MKFGDLVRIAPVLTHQAKWIGGKVIYIGNNPSLGIVISTEQEDSKISLRTADSLTLQKQQQIYV